MHQAAPQTVHSFQQQLSRIQRPNGQLAYVKTIVSDYSWWTFEQTDVLQRELTSYQLLTPLKLVPELVAVDRLHKQFTVEAIINGKPQAGQLQAFLASLITLLKTLKGVPGYELPACSFTHLRRLYLQKGQAAQVNRNLLDELTELVTKWLLYDTHPLSYVHGDLHFGNLLYDGDLIKLIDFEEAIQSHPVIDATSLGWDIMDNFGPDMYAHFKQLYEAEFGVALIELRDWKRFCQLRDWVVGRYLATCCAPEVRERAYQFIIAGEPMARS